MADALEDEGEAEIAGETELELEETGVLELESPLLRRSRPRS